MTNLFKVKCLKNIDKNNHIYDVTINNIYEVFSEFNFNNELNYVIVTNDIRLENVPASLFTKNLESEFICSKCNNLNKKTSYYKSKLQERNLINELAGNKKIIDFCIYCGHSIE